MQQMASRIQDSVSPSPNNAPSWERPGTSYHAHFDCFSGAAGDMMLAACLDASGNPEQLMDYIAYCISKGMPELNGEFTMEQRQVQRGGMASIAGCHVTVHSKYHDAPAPVPAAKNKRQRTEDEKGTEEGKRTIEATTPMNEHDHVHEHDHGDTHSNEHYHEHSCSHRTDGHDHHSHELSHLKGPLRNLPQIQKLLLDASEQYIPPLVKKISIAAFTELAKAEAATHGADGIDSVHFHEVGAIDSIVDTVGTVLAMHCLNVNSVSCSRLPIGEGVVWTAHGCLPIPAPATLRLLVDMPTCPGPLGIVTGELVTPTGAALLRALCMHCPPVDGSKSASLKAILAQGRPPNFTIRKVGIGAGTKDFEKHPNILRLFLGDNLVSK
jgi:uncharacterized protein (DUF111 family)